MHRRTTAAWPGFHSFVRTLGDCAAALLLLLPTRAVLAQGAGAVTVRGVAYDSVRRKPLAGAFVSVAGDTSITTTDAQGRFQLTGIRPGVHTFAAQHAALDSLGFFGLSTRAMVTDDHAEVTLAVPSFATIWRATCGAAPVPKDSGLVYGTIRDGVRDRALGGATVTLTWIDLGVDKKQRAMHQREWRAVTRTTADGGYAICGIPRDVGLRIRAHTDSLASGLIDLTADGPRVQRRDLVAGPPDEIDSVRRGTITGRLTSVTGDVVADARVLVDGVPEVRSNAEGVFIARDVPVGTRQVEMLSIGLMPIVTAVDVAAGDTSRIAATFKKITSLDVVRVTASAVQRRLVLELDERRRAGYGFIVDSSAIAARGTIWSGLTGMPSVQVEHMGASLHRSYVSLPSTRGGRCIAKLWVDGQEQRGFDGDPSTRFEQLTSLHPGDIAVIEVYPRLVSTAMEFASREVDDPCGAVVVWTKWALGR
jgi:hypothetical protein